MIQTERLITTNEDMEEVLGNISFINSVVDFKWKFVYMPFDKAKIGKGNPNQGRAINTGWLLHVEFERPDIITGAIGIGHGRSEIVWSGATESGLVKTAWLLVELMIRHELMEGFNYKGKKIFNPHNTVDALISIQE